MFFEGDTLLFISLTLPAFRQRPVAGHSPLSSKITHYIAPLLLPALSIDWLFNGGIKLAQSDIIYALHV